MIRYLLDDNASLPEKGTEASSGYDIRATKIIAVFRGVEKIPQEELKLMQEEFNTTGKITIKAFNRVLFGTGLKAVIPENKEIHIKSRSGMSLKRGLLVANSPGLIDSDYRDEIGIIVINSTPFENVVFYNERIAQLTYHDRVYETQSIISETEFNKYLTNRTGGFGHTGTK
jgi:dUTP pyrophosphatase